MELCRGGELIRRIGARHYSERTVASYMRAVLRTLVQCHGARILHRDVKPGNFMLLNDDERSPLKAVDFGLARRVRMARPHRPPPLLFFWLPPPPMAAERRAPAGRW